MDWEAFLSSEYNVKIKNVELCIEGLIYHTSKGKKLLNTHKISKERIMLAHELKKHISNKGLYNSDHFLENKRGLPYSETNNQIITLTDVLNGRECDFGSKIEVLKASRELAVLHTCMEGFKTSYKLEISNASSLDKLPLLMKKKMNELRKYRNYALKRQTEFDYAFLGVFNQYFKLGNEIIDRLNNVNYQKVIKNAINLRQYCHGNISFKNILLSDEEVYFKGFEHVRGDAFIMDVADLMRKRLEKCNWDINEALYILKTYCEIKKISKIEIELLELILKFPWRLGKVSNRYYNSRRSWPNKACWIKLEEVINAIKPHHDFSIQHFRQND